MEEVAKLFEVELNEEFEIKMPNENCYAIAKFTSDGLVIIQHNVFNTDSWLPYVLKNLLIGVYAIKKKPWKPKFNEKYYSVGVDGSVEDGTWLNDFLDYTLYKIGNCYRTVEEARANRVRWGKFYDSDKILNI